MQASIVTTTSAPTASASSLIVATATMRCVPRGGSATDFDPLDRDRKLERRHFRDRIALREQSDRLDVGPRRERPIDDEFHRHCPPLSASRGQIEANALPTVVRGRRETPRAQEYPQCRARQRARAATGEGQRASHLQRAAPRDRCANLGRCSSECSEISDDVLDLRRGEDRFAAKAGATSSRPATL